MSEGSPYTKKCRRARMESWLLTSNERLSAVTICDYGNGIRKHLPLKTTALVEVAESQCIDAKEAQNSLKLKSAHASPTFKWCSLQAT